METNVENQAMMKKTRMLPAVLFCFGASIVGAETMPTPEKMINEGNYRGTPWISGGVGEGGRKYLMRDSRFKG
jgi:hypothetical protein